MCVRLCVCVCAGVCVCVCVCKSESGGESQVCEMREKEMHMKRCVREKYEERDREVCMRRL